MDCRGLFATQGLRFTRQRCAIFEALATCRSHPTAEQLYELVRAQCRGLSLATVYNTLDALCESGLCVRVPVERGSARYDANLRWQSDGNGGMRPVYDDSSDPHLHAIDETSGEIHDVPDDLGREILEHIPPHLVERVENELGFKIDRISLQFVGRGDDSAASAVKHTNGKPHTSSAVPTG